MPRFKDNCEVCGMVEVSGRRVKLLYCTTTYEYTYIVWCDQCNTINVKPATAKIIELLLSEQCYYHEWSMPEQPIGTGPPISPADVNNFIEALNGHSNLADRD